MKTKFPSMFGVLAALLLVASFIIPINLVSPSPVEAGVCKWDTVDMPGSIAARADVMNTTEATKLAVGGDGATILTIVNMDAAPPALVYRPVLFTSSMMGLMWSTAAYQNLIAATGFTAFTGFVFDVAIAPDNPTFWAVVTGDTAAAPQEVWITENAGGKWERTGLATTIAGIAGYLGPVEVGAIDISVDYGGQRDIAVGMREGAAALNFSIFVLQSQGFSGWRLQANLPPNVVNGDVFALKFSPSYPADGALAAVFATPLTVAIANRGAFYNIALRDVDLNTINQWALLLNLELWITAAGAGNSPNAQQLITADLELPSDFNGQAASLRRAYISTDSGFAAGVDDGIFRVDNSTLYVLMNTTPATDTRRIATISYFGTYASGKLLAGAVSGFECSATVPTWFTDSPTTCPVPCWYDALKPPTGSGGATCTLNAMSPGNAQVAWFQGGALALALTGTYTLTSGNGTNWWAPLVLNPPFGNDETALSLSRNNGETWNQIALIDTTITKFNDFAASADCTTLYLASSSDNVTTPISCLNFDSVWRSSLNAAVVSPLPPIPPLGLWYERVYTRTTGLTCEAVQTDLPLLRLPPGCVEPTGQIIGWAAQNTQAQAWSPDYGDFWANITARNNITDFAFESSTILYNLYTIGTVQKLPYTGTAWGSTLPSVNPGFGAGHMITAMPEGKVLIGYLTASLYPAVISNDGGANFTALLQPLQGQGNIHVAFDPAFADNSIVYVGTDAATGSVYRQSVAGAPLVERWAEVDMLAAINGAIGCPLGLAHGGIFGLALAHTGAMGMTALYAADGTALAGVWRTLNPLDGMPKPGMVWDQINTNITTAGVVFTREPYSLKLCGCCTLDTDTQLYALDNANYVAATRVGFLWSFTDCLAKTGPALITEDKALIGCDPVSGRSQEVNLCWEQLCVAGGYDIEIAKNAEFTIKVIDWVAENICINFLVPADITQPCVYFPAGGAATLGNAPASGIAVAGNLECGHTYYWRVKVRDCVTGEIIRSPWSEVRSFTVKAGLPVTTPYYGPQLLAPNNGCLGCSVQPACFSWSPFKETMKYKFVLASDAAMTQVVTEAEVSTTAFEYDGTLNYSTNYFWRVMSLEPAPSDWSATFSLMTEAAPSPVTPDKPAPTPVWVWVVIAIGAILVIVTLVLIFKTRRV